MDKVVEMGKRGKGKPDEDCMLCGATPACPKWTCKRLSAVSVDPDGGWSVEFIRPDELEMEFTPEE